MLSLQTIFKRSHTKDICNILKELQRKYPNKSVAELYAEFTDNDERLKQLFFGQLREQ